MIFNENSALEGKHSVLSASKPHWVRYDDEKMLRVYKSLQAAKRGTELHEFARRAIELGIKLRGTNTLAQYVNDCIGWKMTPEQVLFYSEYAFATPDAISFRRNTLRINDLKTGETPAKPEQLEIYAGYFCLEYRYKPHQIKIELRIYQNDDIIEWDPDRDHIVHIMDKIVSFDKLFRQAEEEGLLL